jgi:hypothetical protein
MSDNLIDFTFLQGVKIIDLLSLRQGRPVPKHSLGSVPMS